MKKVRFEVGWHLYSLIIGFIIVALALGVVYAYGGTNPVVHGHDSGEIGGLQEGGSVLECTEYTGRPAGETGEDYCSSLGEECIAIFSPDTASYSDECSVSPQYAHITRCCKGSNIVSVESDYACHWEKSWKTYPTEGADLDEKTSCDVGVCQFKADSIDCDLMDLTCKNEGNIQPCARTGSDRNEMLYCC